MSIKIGDIGESRFITKALEYGYHPCLPFSQDTKFDILLVTYQKQWRVQVKACNHLSKSKRYEFNMSNGRDSKSPYSPYDVDIVACYVMPKDKFYFFFKTTFQNKTRINIYPNNSKYDIFKNIWDQL